MFGGLWEFLHRASVVQRRSTYEEDFSRSKAEMSAAFAKWPISLACAVTMELYPFDQLSIVRSRGLRAVPRQWRRHLKQYLSNAEEFGGWTFGMIGTTAPPTAIVDPLECYNHYVSSHLPTGVAFCSISASVPYPGFLLLSATVFPNDDYSQIIETQCERLTIDDVLRYDRDTLVSPDIVLMERIAKQTQKLVDLPMLPQMPGLFGARSSNRLVVPIWRIERSASDFGQAVRNYAISHPHHSDAEFIDFAGVLGISDEGIVWRGDEAFLVPSYHMSCGLRCFSAFLVANRPRLQKFPHGRTWIKERLDTDENILGHLDDYLPVFLIVTAANAVRIRMNRVRAQLERRSSERQGSWRLASLQALLMASATHRYRLARLREAATDLQEYPYSAGLRVLQGKKDNEHDFRSWSQSESLMELDRASRDIDLSIGRVEELLLLSSRRFDRLLLLLALLVALGSLGTSLLVLIHH